MFSIDKANVCLSTAVLNIEIHNSDDIFMTLSEGYISMKQTIYLVGTPWILCKKRVVLQNALSSIPELIELNLSKGIHLLQQ